MNIKEGWTPFLMHDISPSEITRLLIEKGTNLNVASVVRSILLVPLVILFNSSYHLSN